MGKAKWIIAKQCRIGDNCFTSLATIGGNLFTRHPNNLNHVHKDSNNVLSVIIIWGEMFIVAKQFFMMDKKLMTLLKENMF